MQAGKRYEALDGLRGCAAIGVMLFHLNQWLGISWLASNAGCAVDFFFCLSGFILSVVYRRRFASGLGTMAFMRMRLIRLMPAIMIAALISGAYLVARMVIFHDPHIAPAEVAMAVALGALCLPMFGASHAVGGPLVFPINGPEYTLMLEFVVNAVWSATRRMNSVVWALGIAGSCYAIEAVLGSGGDQPGTFWLGFPRVFASYYMGVAIAEASWRHAWVNDPRWRWVFAPAVLVSAVLFFWPVGATLGVVLIWDMTVSPLIVLSGAQVLLSGRARAAALHLGELSFPLYALHYPIFVWVNAIFQQTQHHKQPLPEAALFAPLIPLIGWGLYRLVETGLREKVTRWFEPRAALG